MSKTLFVEYNRVLIIDCLPEDQFNQFQISNELIESLKTNFVEHQLFICRSKHELISTLNHLADVTKSGENICLHIISHGSEYGICLLTSQELVYWAEFTDLLENINVNLNGTLLVNISSCLGLNAIKIIDENSYSTPFFGLVGYSKILEIERAKEINNLFYNKLLVNPNINEVVEEIKQQLEDKNFYCITSSGYKRIKSYL